METENFPSDSPEIKDPKLKFLLDSVAAQMAQAEDRDIALSETLKGDFEKLRRKIDNMAVDPSYSPTPEVIAEYTKSAEEILRLTNAEVSAATAHEPTPSAPSQELPN